MLFADESMMFRFAKVAFQLPEIRMIIVNTIEINTLCRSHCSVSSLLSIPGCWEQRGIMIRNFPIKYLERPTKHVL